MLLEHTEDGLAEAKLLHPGDAGWFAIMRRLPGGQWMSNCHPLSHLDIVMPAVARNQDIYLSQASFTAPKRRLAFLSNIRAAWVDIDCYNCGEEASQVFVDEVVSRAVAAGLPRPSYVIRSGRGLYAKWIFEQQIDASNLPVWDALQSSLVATFKAIGADVRARDAARVLRTLGSTNSKAPQQPVHMAWGDDALVDFTKLCEAAASVRIDHAVQDDCPKKERSTRIAEVETKKKVLAELTPSITNLAILDQYAQTREPILLDAHSARALHWHRFLDLRTLAHLRGGVPRGSRDTFLFWMMTCLANAGVVNARNFWTELADLSRFIDSQDYRPMQDGSMGSLFERVKASQNCQGPRSAIYCPSNARLIDLLEVSPQEQLKLITLIEPHEKLRRQDEKAPGRAEHRLRLETARPLVLSLLDEGAPVTEVAKRIGVDRRQIYRWTQARDLREENPQAVLRNGRAAALREGAIDARLLNQVTELLHQKTTHRQICMRLGLSESALRRVLQEMRQLRDRATHAPEQTNPQQSQARAELTQRALDLRLQARRLQAQAERAQAHLSVEVQLRKVRKRISLGRTSAHPSPATRAIAEAFEPAQRPDEAQHAAIGQILKLQQAARMTQLEADKIFAQLQSRLLALPSDGEVLECGLIPNNNLPSRVCIVTSAHTSCDGRVNTGGGDSAQLSPPVVDQTAHSHHSKARTHASGAPTRTRQQPEESAGCAEEGTGGASAPTADFREEHLATGPAAESSVISAARARLRQIVHEYAAANPDPELRPGTGPAPVRANPP